jgi:hypothetical protein
LNSLITDAIARLRTVLAAIVHVREQLADGASLDYLEHVLEHAEADLAVAVEQLEADRAA